jgi:hypothetical protein
MRLGAFPKSVPLDLLESLELLEGSSSSKISSRLHSCKMHTVNFDTKKRSSNDLLYSKKDDKT